MRTRVDEELRRTSGLAFGTGSNVTPASPPEAVHRFWRAGWWPVASAIVATGADCTVLDPDAEASEAFFDGHPDHGVISVHPHSGLGWTVTVSETETVDDGTEP